MEGKQGWFCAVDRSVNAWDDECPSGSRGVRSRGSYVWGRQTPRMSTWSTASGCGTRSYLARRQVTRSRRARHVVIAIITARRTLTLKRRH